MVPGPSALLLSFATMVLLAAATLALTVVAILAWTGKGDSESFDATFNVAFVLIGLVAVVYLSFEARLAIEAAHRYTTVLGRNPQYDLCDWKTGVVVSSAGDARPASLRALFDAANVARRSLDRAAPEEVATKRLEG